MGISDLITDAVVTAADGAHCLHVPPSCLPRLALFLDMDGVLVPLVATPDAIVPEPGLTAVIRSVNQRLKGRVAVISGRTIAEIDRIIECELTAVAGVHGLERRRTDGSLDQVEPDPSIRAIVEAFQMFARSRPGIIVEDKGLSAGIHFRQALGEADAVAALASRLADETGLALQSGNLVMELKTPGADKGTALTAFMAEPLFRNAVPVMVGDDLTDEDGFRAATAMGGFGVLVGAHRETGARYGLPDVKAVLNWLTSIEDGF